MAGVDRSRWRRGSWGGDRDADRLFNLRSHLANALQSESRTGTINRATQRLRHGFIVAQIALAFVLLAGAALLGLSLKKSDGGFARISPRSRSHRRVHRLMGSAAGAIGIMDRLLESIRQQPGIAATGTITNIPLTGDSGKTAVTPRGYVRRRVNQSMAIIPMPFTAITFRPSALTCAKDASSLRKIPTARNASVWWTKIWPGVY